MGRKSGIWLRKQNKTWYVNHNGRQVNLGKDKAFAEKAYHKLMAADALIGKPVGAITAAELMDKFLLWCKDNRAERTFDWYKQHLQVFLDRLKNQNIEAAGIKPFHVYEAVTKSWSDTFKRGFMLACQRAFTWGTKHGYIGESPLRHLEKPAATRRDNCPTAADYEAMLKHTTDCFRDFLEFA